MKHSWRGHVKNLEIKIGVGIYEYEQKKQRIIVNAIVEGEYPTKPLTINDCFNYEYIHNLVVDEWPKKEHKPLMENSVDKLLQHKFRSDERVDYASVRVCKPDISPHAEAVGVEAEWTRKDFKKIVLGKA